MLRKKNEQENIEETKESRVLPTYEETELELAELKRQLAAAEERERRQHESIDRSIKQLHDVEDEFLAGRGIKRKEHKSLAELVARQKEEEQS